MSRTMVAWRMEKPGEPLVKRELPMPEPAAGEVLMVAYMNEDSLRETIRRGEAVYWSRSRQKLWHKGGTSGHVQVIKNILTDCDQDALVLKVRQKGPGCCHNGYRSCFYRRVTDAEDNSSPVPLAPEIAEKSYDPKEVYG